MVSNMTWDDIEKLAFFGEFDKIQEYVKQNPNAKRDPNLISRGTYYAAKGGHMDIINYFLDMGMDPHIAIRGAKVSCFKEIILRLNIRIENFDIINEIITTRPINLNETEDFVDIIHSLNVVLDEATKDIKDMPYLKTTIDNIIEQDPLKIIQELNAILDSELRFL
jgi:hypothetical protein